LGSAPSTAAAASAFKKIEEPPRKNEVFLKKRSRGAAFSSGNLEAGNNKTNKAWVFSFLATMFMGIGGATLGTFLVHCAEKEGEGCEDDCIERKCGDSDCLRKMDGEEEMIRKANSELEKALKDVKPKAIELTEAALKAFCEGAELIKIFIDKVYCAVEEENLMSPRFEAVWCDVYDAAMKRCEKAKEALAKGTCAWEMLCRLREVIENGKSCKYTSCNPLLVTAEEALLCAERELLNSKAKMECLLAESRVVEQFRNLIEDFRRDLKAELDSMIPSEDCKGTLTANECTMVLTHAYKKILRIQKELASIQGAASTPAEAAPANDCNTC